jgi:hypothetical protein
VSGHSLKIAFCMFKRSQGKHNSSDCHKSFWNIFHLIAKFICSKLTQINFCFSYSKHSNLQSGQTLYIFQMSFFPNKCTPFLLKIGEYLNIND